MKRCRVLSFAVLALGLARSPVARADDVRSIDEAKKAFELGIQRYQQGDVEGARLALTQSYAVYPAAETLRNLAIAELHSRHFLEAADHFFSYARSPDADRAFLLKLPALLEECEQHLGHLRILEAGEAVVTVDGRRVDDVRDPVDVVPGTHAVALGSAEDRIERSVAVAARQTALVDLRPSSASAPAPLAAPAPPSPASPLASPLSETSSSGASSPSWWTGPRFAAVTLAGVAAVGVAAGLALHASADGNANDAQALRGQLAQGQCVQPPASASCTSLKDNLSALSRNDALSTAGFVVAGAAAVSSVLTWALGGKPASVRAGNLTLTPVLAPSLAAVHGSF